MWQDRATEDRALGVTRDTERVTSFLRLQGHGRHIHSCVPCEKETSGPPSPPSGPFHPTASWSSRGLEEVHAVGWRRGTR